MIREGSSKRTGVIERRYQAQKDSDLQEERAIGRTGEEQSLCIHGYPEGLGCCYMCDPNHSYRLKEMAKA